MDSITNEPCTNAGCLTSLGLTVRKQYEFIIAAIIPFHIKGTNKLAEHHVYKHNSNPPPMGKSVLLLSFAFHTKVLSLLLLLSVTLDILEDVSCVVFVWL